MLVPKAYNVTSDIEERCSMEGRAWQAGTASRAKRLVQYMMKGFFFRVCVKEEGLKKKVIFQDDVRV